jgi:DNA gyrase subunit A
VGRCIRFSADEVRVFASRDSTGVRGVRLAEGDSVISMAILRNVDATPAERAAYLKHRAPCCAPPPARRATTRWRS